MGIDDLDPDQFDEVWETQKLGDRADGLAQTATMKPESQTELAGSNDAELIGALPNIGDAGSDTTMPAIELHETIGEGGMARVVVADQIPLHRQVAVKMLRHGRNAGQRSLLQEAWVTGRLEHPNVIPVYRLGRDHQGDPAIVMKRIEGIPWSELLEDPTKAPRAVDANDPLDWHLDILMDVCNAVHYAHSQRIIHRDLKPSNVMVGAFGEVYVLDWGLAVSLDEDPDGYLPTISDLHTPAGTPGYMAPEMLAGVGDLLSEQTDIYLLGAILHHIIAGSPPHEGSRMYEVFEQAYQSEPRDYADDVPEQLADIARRAMARKPQDRFDSAEEMRRALVRFKRARQSYRLSRGAHEKLDELESLLAGGEADNEDIQETFGECRFGFEKALEVSDANASARDGLQRALEAMINYQLDRDGYEAASLLLADLPEPRPALSARVDRLGEELASREQEFEELKSFKRESDVNLGRNARSIVALALGVLWAGLGYAPVALRRWFDVQIGFGDYLAQGVIVSIVLGTVFYVGRRSLFQNIANKQIMIALVLVFGCEWLARYAMRSAGMALPMTMSVEMMMSGMATGILGATIDRRIGWAMLPYMTAGLVAASFPEWVYECNALANFVGMGAIALAWWSWDDVPNQSATSR